MFFQVCKSKNDQGHDWSDIWIGRPDGSMNRQLTRGGTQICFLNPEDGSSTPPTQSDSPQWEFRPDWSRDSKRIFFCHARTGENPSIWVMDRDGKHQRRLTDGIDGNGADFPRWVG